MSRGEWQAFKGGETQSGRDLFMVTPFTRLARTHTFEQVAEMLWTGELAKPPPWLPDPAGVTLGRAVQRVLPARTLAFDRVRVVVAALAGSDPFRHDLRREAVAGAARRLLATLVDCLPRRRGGGSSRTVRDERRREPASFAARVWDRVSTRPAAGRQLFVGLRAAL